MEQRGWVRRRPADGRAVALALTAPGRRTVAKLLRARDTALAGVLEPLDAEERRRLEPLLEKLLAARTAERRDLERLCRLCDRGACERRPVEHALG